ncbi:MAG: hypothetical protein RLZZ502_1182, partial [Pseudomonadota bacterium]
GLPPLKPEPGTPHILPYFTLDVLAKIHGSPLNPWVLEALHSVDQLDQNDHLQRQWPAPDFKIDTHRMYRGQWLLFAALALVLWLVLNTRKLSPGS